MRYFSQMKQDEILDRFVFRGKIDGYFVDVGAYDGVKYSNSLFFEKYRNWLGICIEPIPKIFQQLETNRPTAICIEGCTGKENLDTVNFNWVDGPSEMLSGIASDYHPSHVARILAENRQLGGVNRSLTVPMFTLEKIFDENEIKYVHYLSVDTEGSELQTLQGINFDKVTIDIIDVEENYESDAQKIAQFLSSQGYRKFHDVGIDSLYAREELLPIHIPPFPQTLPANKHTQTSRHRNRNKRRRKRGVLVRKRR